MSEKFSAMRNSPDLFRSGDSLGENQDSPSLKQLNYRAQQNISQVNNHLKTENSEHIKADSDLENELSKMEISNEMELGNFLDINFPNNHNAKVVAEKYFKERKSLGIDVSFKKLKVIILEELEKKENLSMEQRIKNYTESLKGEKSNKETLHLLIAKFENIKGVETLVGNFKNYLKLYQLAESKPPQERKAIQNIISKADFSDENAFNVSLQEIAQSTEISNETKFEISREFNGANVFSIDDLNHTLQEVKNHREEIDQVIETKSHEKNALKSEISDLENKAEKLPHDSPERAELEAEIEQKKERLKNAETEISQLEKRKPQKTEFVLRQGFLAKLNKDGSRSINIAENDFSIRIPSNMLPFTDTRNLRAINLAFPYKILKDLHIADTIFSPLENDSVPTKSQRNMSHLILSSLGIDDSKIISEHDIKKLKKDLSELTKIPAKSPQDCLIELGIFDIHSRSINKTKFHGILKGIRDKKITISTP